MLLLVAAQVHSAAEGDPGDAGGVRVFRAPRGDWQLAAVCARRQQRQRVADRLRQDDAAAVGPGDRPRVALGGRQPRGRLLGRRQQPAVHLQAGAATTPTAVSPTSENLYQMRNRANKLTLHRACAIRRPRERGFCRGHVAGRGRAPPAARQAGIHFACM
jgi:hypothetical protein